MADFLRCAACAPHGFNILDQSGPKTMKPSILTRPFFALLALLLVSGCGGIANTGSSYTETGGASFYAMKYQSRLTANGERFDQAAMTAAHKKLPFGTRIKVTNVENGKSVIVRVNDRGPFVEGRVVDLSRSAFSQIGNTGAGVIHVVIEVVD